MTVTQKLPFANYKDKNIKFYLQIRFHFLRLPVLMKCFSIKFPGQFCSKFWLISMLHRVSSQLLTI